MGSHPDALGGSLPSPSDERTTGNQQVKKSEDTVVIYTVVPLMTAFFEKKSPTNPQPQNPPRRDGMKAKF